MKPPKPKRHEDMSEAEKAFARVMIKYSSRINVGLYRLTGGRLGGKFLAGEPLLLLDVRGRKTGQSHTFPLIYLEDGDNLVVVASKGGWPEHPEWYKNLVVNPDVEVQVGPRVSRRLARTASDAERAALWPRLCALYPPYQDYQDVTERQIPVVILEPRP